MEHIARVKYDEELKERIEKQLLKPESMALFFYRAGIEKLNRMEVRNEQERRNQFQKDYEALKPIVKAMKDRGEL